LPGAETLYASTPMAETSHADATLDALRAEIDACDDALLALLARRAGVVERLAASAAKPAGTVLRPGREAAILRRLLAAHRGPPAPAAVVRIWREIFASSLAQQGDFAVAVAGGAPSLALAAAHFGAGTPLHAQEAPLDQLAAGRAAVAVLPWPAPAEDTPWWTTLDRARFAVIARLPFHAEVPPAAEAAVVALYPADASGRDLWLWRGPAALAGAGARVLARHGALALAESETPPPPGAEALGRYAIPLRGAHPG
jgi:chorismate mutase/prephenate dehydratase